MAQLDARSTGDQEVAVSTPAGSATFFPGDLIMKYDSRRAVNCPFLAKECAQYLLTAERTKPAQ